MKIAHSGTELGQGSAQPLRWHQSTSESSLLHAFAAPWSRSSRLPSPVVSLSPTVSAFPLSVTMDGGSSLPSGSCQPSSRELPCESRLFKPCAVILMHVDIGCPNHPDTTYCEAEGRRHRKQYSRLTLPCRTNMSPSSLPPSSKLSVSQPSSSDNTTRWVVSSSSSLREGMVNQPSQLSVSVSSNSYAASTP